MSIPLIIAHRGAPREAPENTIPAIERALQHGADGMEIDVLLTADDILVLSHNDELSLLTASPGRIRDLPLALLQNIDAGSHLAEQWRGTRIPTLHDVLDLLAPTGVQVMLDMKVQRGALQKTCSVLLKLLGRHAFRERLFVASASLRFLSHLQQCAPQLQRALTVESGYQWVVQRLFFPKTNIAFASTNHRVITAAYSKAVHQRSQKLLAWTVNDRADVLRCIELGVDAIITDDVPLVKTVLRRG